MKVFLTTVLIGLCLTGCSLFVDHSRATGKTTSRLSEDEKHRLYTAALAASDSPLENDTFKEVCQRIGIFNAGGAPNDVYLPFVSAHVDWAMKGESEQFKQEIRTKERAREYLHNHLPGLH
jgi:hypothetical protein